MKSLMMLWTKLANESASRCCTSATRDVKTVTRRVEHEGLSFLTITLPEFGKAIQKSLDQAKVVPSDFQGFHFGNRCLPVFLQGFTERVFDPTSGVLLDAPCIEAIRALRQLTLLLSKVQLPCSDAREKDALYGYIECERSVRDHDSRLSDDDLSDFHRVSRVLFASTFSRADRKVYLGEVSPKHGPGTTADKLLGNEKWNQRVWTRRLEAIFPSGENLLPNWRYYDQLDAVDTLEPGAETPVKVVSVPKTLKTPRIIGVEPTAMQYVQQGVLQIILESLSEIDTSDRTSRFKKKFLTTTLGFTDQTPNQRMACEGSRSGNLATLDLSEASDRVSNQLVRTMLTDHPYLLQGVDACRSRRANVLGKTIRLAKFASMGSALTFPFEAMVFLTLVVVGVERELNTHLEWSDSRLRDLLHKVRIYGDDIIIPVEFVPAVLDVLSTFGAKVNVGKSFWNGKFRESCGREYYDGNDVSIVKVRQVFPATRRDVTEVISLVSLRNQLFLADYLETVEWLDSIILKVIKHFPEVGPNSPVLGRLTHGPLRGTEWDKDLQRPCVRGYVVSAQPPSNSLDGMGALLKFLLKRGGLPSVDSKHLERSGRPQRVDIKLRRAPLY